VLGCPWQRCSVHFLRETARTRAASNGRCSARCWGRSSMPTRASRHANSSVTRSTVAQTAAEDRRVARRDRGRPARLLPLPGRPPAEAAPTNPLERVNLEIGRPHRDAVGTFPNDRSLIRLAASIVSEQNDEWLVGKRYLSNHSLEALLDQKEERQPTRGDPRAHRALSSPTIVTTSHTTRGT
jgi:putative transposase